MKIWILILEYGTFTYYFWDMGYWITSSWTRKMFWLRGWELGGGGEGRGAGRAIPPPDNISLTILIISPASITSRQAGNRHNFGEPGLAIYTKCFDCFDSWDPLLKETDWYHLVTLGHFKKFNVASKMATKNMPVTNLAIPMFYNQQNASFMHISSPVNAIEDDYVTLG